MSVKPGRKVQRLAKLLQSSFPDRNGVPVIWEPEKIYPVQGAWRSMDVWRWEAVAHFVNDDGSLLGVAYSVGSYGTITELIKAERLMMIGGDEVEPYRPPALKPKGSDQHQEQA